MRGIMKKKAYLILVVLICLVLAAGILVACNPDSMGQVVKFAVNFDVDGQIYDTISTTGGERLEMPANPTKDGYVFDGWYWDKDTWQRPFTAESLLSTPLSTDMTVYAKWVDEDLRTVVFDARGYGEIDSQSVLIGELLTKPENPIRNDGYVCVGWYTDLEYTEKWDFNLDRVADNMTLYARWVDEDDATGDEILVAEGFEFGGTEYEPTLYTRVPNAQDHFVLSTSITVSPYAEWTVSSDMEGNETIPSATVPLEVGDNVYYIHLVSGSGHNQNQYKVTIHRRDIFSVTWNFNNGQESIREDIEEDSLLTAKEVDEKPGYTFVSWNYGNVAWDFEEDVVVGDMILDATYRGNGIDIAFDSDGGSEVAATQVIFGSKFELPVPTKTGYAFLGWQTADGDMLTDENGESLAAWDILEAVEVKAVWVVIHYDIIYHNVEGATHTNPVDYTVTTGTFTLKAASKVGYTFDGWFADEIFETPAETAIEVGSIGDLNFYAKWTPIVYDLTFILGNGEYSDGQSNAATYTIEDTVEFVDPVSTRAGYEFDGWRIGSIDGERVESIEEGTYGNKTFYAVWKPIVYTITYAGVYDGSHTNPVTYTIESATIMLTDGSRTGYTFAGWYNGEERIIEIEQGNYGDLTLTAKWDTISYDLFFVMENEEGGYDGHYSDKENPSSYTIEDEVIFIEPVCDIRGYEFKGWYTAKTGGEKVESIPVGSTGVRTYYAQWQRSEYTITYHNIVEEIDSNPSTYNIDTETFTLVSPSKIGYIFVGWYSDEALENVVSATVEKGSIGDLHFYAKWQAEVYDITYVLYDGINSKDNPTSYIIEDDIEFAAPTREGYSFGGWFTSGDFTTEIKSIQQGTTGNMTLYARWYYIGTVTFETNGGSEIEPITQEYGTVLEAPTNPTKDYYEFVGWYSDITLETAYDFTTMPDKDFTLYAKWLPVEYTITYVMNGGENASENPATYNVETETIVLVDPSKMGYSFVAWFTNAEFTSEVVTEISLGSHGNITLYANFAINEYTISFDTNGGSTVDPITQDYATSVTAPAAPSRNGYRFDGWYSDKTLETVYTFTTIPAEDITLYAKWTLINYTINYNLEGGINNVSNPASYTIESGEVIFSAPTKHGYEFIGWYSDGVFEQEITSISAGSYGELTIFAKWEIIVYDITYIGAEGLIHDNPTTYTVEDSVTFVAIDKYGYTYNGLFEEDSYETAVTRIEQGSIGNIAVYVNFIPNVYDVWMDGKEIANYTVSFNLNGAGGSVDAQIITEGVTLTYPEIPSRSGYVFAGWYTTASCVGEPYDFTAQIGDDITLYAKWVAMDGEVINVGDEIDINIAGSALHSYTFIPLVSGNVTISTTGNLDTIGYLYDAEGTLLKANDDGATDGNFLIVYNVTAGKEYTIEFRGYSQLTSGSTTLHVAGSLEVPDGGTVAETGGKTSVTFGQSFTITVPDAREGFVFRGWADAEGNLYTDETGLSIKMWDKAEETVLYSVWEADGFTVTFVTNGGTDVEDVIIPFGDRLDVNEYVTTRENYSFMGWYLSASDSEPYNASTMPDHDITLYARWTSYRLEAIKYDESLKAISALRDVTADDFGATCFDSDGMPVELTATVNGTQEAGETVTVRLMASKNGKSAVATITEVKVYGAPTLSIGNEQTYFNLKDGLTAEWFEASGTDTYDEPTEIRVYVDGEYGAGDLVTVVIGSVDPAGNITSDMIENVQVYGEPIIIYDEELAGISVNYDGSVPALNATAVDSFGEELEVETGLYSDVMVRWQAEVNISGTTLRSYTFTALSSGRVTIYTISNLDTYGDLYYNNSRIASDDDDGTGNNFSITYNVTEGRTYTVQVRGFSSSTSGTAILYVEGDINTASMTFCGVVATSPINDIIEYEGEVIVLSFTTTDSKGNVSTLILDNVKVYAAPVINEATNTAFKDDDNVTVESLGLTATDTFGDAADVEIEIESGVFAPGNEVTYLITATDAVGNVTMDNVTIKVYGDINVTYGLAGAKPDTVVAEDLEIVATDSFGSFLDVELTLESGVLEAGNTVTFRIYTTDIAGNVYDIIKEYKVYGESEIQLTYDPWGSLDVKLSSKGEEFSATATDSYGEACDITIERADGGALIAGEVQDIVIVATDAAGNRKMSEVIANAKIFDMPMVRYMHENLYILEGEDVQFMFIATDSFNQEIYVDVSIVNETDTSLEVKIRVQDNANNIVDEQYVITKLADSSFLAILSIDGQISSQTHNKGMQFMLPVPEKEGFDFYGWQNEEGEFVTDSTGVAIQEITNDSVVLYARWTSHIVIIDSSDNSIITEYDSYVGYNLEIEVEADKGYRADKYFVDGNEIASNTFVLTSSEHRISVEFVIATYKISYVLNGGTNSSLNPTTYTINSSNITLYAATKQNYTFDGWYLDANFTNKVTKIMTFNAKDYVLYAKFTRIVYVVTVKAGNGEELTLRVNKGNQGDLAACYIDLGSQYLCGGYYYDSNYNTPMTSRFFDVNGNMTIYMKTKAYNASKTFRGSRNTETYSQSVKAYGEEFMYTYKAYWGTNILYNQTYSLYYIVKIDDVKQTDVNGGTGSHVASSATITRKYRFTEVGVHTITVIAPNAK